MLLALEEVPLLLCLYGGEGPFPTESQLDATACVCQRDNISP